MNETLVVFRLSFLALITLSTMTLTAAEGQLFPQGLTIVIAFVTYVMTDTRRDIEVPAGLAALMGFMAIGAAIFEFFQSIEGRILSIAHLVAYFIWIVLLQRKQVYQYWMLAAFCVLQMALASALTESALYGVSLVLFLFLSIWTLSIFSVYRAGLRVNAFAPQGDASRAQRAAGNAVATRAARLQPPLIDFLSPPASTTRGSIHLERGESWINSRFLLGVFLITLASFFVAVFFFAYTPQLRLNQSWRYSDQDLAPGEALTGLSEKVELGDITKIAQNFETAFTVRFVDEALNEPIDVENYFSRLGYGSPKFRGVVMSQYDDGQWKAFHVTPEIPVPGSRPFGTVIRQEYRIETKSLPKLVSLQPAVNGNLKESDQPLWYRQDSRTITARRRNQRLGSALNMSGMEYDLYAPRITTQVPGRPTLTSGNSDRTETRILRSQNYLDLLKSLPRNRLSRLIEFANELVREREEDLGRRLSTLEKCDLIETYFRSSEEYGYSLENLAPESDVDPVEYFVFTSKSGHCEYYASAIALMLRAVDVPTRLVTGYMGGRTDRGTLEYEVQQLHAHAWVEAFDEQQRDWVIVDGTPPSRETSVSEVDENGSNDIFGFSRDLWRSYIVDFNEKTQRRYFYAPVARLFSQTWDSVSDEASLIPQLIALLQEMFRDPSKLFSLQGGIVTGVFCLLVIFLWWLGKRVGKFIMNRVFKTERSSRHQSRTVEFYERFKKLMSEQRLFREVTQTPREFADSVGRELSPALAGEGAVTIPQDVTSAYYKIRFGHKSLPNDELRQVMGQLESLELHLKEWREKLKANNTNGPTTNGQGNGKNGQQSH